MTRRSTLRAGAAAALTLALPLTATLTFTAPASAQVIVSDPTNYAQNVLQAARALDQINNQIQSLTNEAQSLVNQARNLASLPYSSLQSLQRSVQRTQDLLGQAQRVAYDVRDIDRAFTTTYGANAGSSNEAMVRNAHERWRTSVSALQDALRVQAGVVGNIGTNRAEMQALITSSQSATGALQATQAGNQLLALQAQQLADLTAAVAAQGRAQALDAAERQAAADQGREQRRRFLTRTRGYQPTNVRMFGGRD